MNRPSTISVSTTPSAPLTWDAYDRGYEFTVITPGQGAILRHPETGHYIPVWVSDVIVIASRGEGFKAQYGLSPLTEFDLSPESEFSWVTYWDSESVTPAHFLEFADPWPDYIRSKSGGTD